MKNTMNNVKRNIVSLLIFLLLLIPSLMIINVIVTSYFLNFPTILVTLVAGFFIIFLSAIVSLFISKSLHKN